MDRIKETRTFPHRQQALREALASLPAGRLLDLGAGHPLFSSIAVECGHQVTAVDARVTRWEHDPQIKFVQADARGFPVAGYDVVLCLGLLYHLRAVEQLDLLDRIATSGAALVLDTHFAARPIVTERGYWGEHHTEKPEAPTAAWQSNLSFWPLKGELLRMLRNSGFQSVEQIGPEHPNHRAFFLAQSTEGQ